MSAGHCDRHPVLPRDRSQLLERIRRIEGQVRGIGRMIEEDRYCVDVLVQIAAARSALDNLGMLVLEGHVKGCVAQALREGQGDEAVRELLEVVRKFLR
ncbi:MAG: metal-sensitive transcriptional regulator [Bacillota bacterium]